MGELNNRGGRLEKPSVVGLLLAIKVKAVGESGGGVQLTREGGKRSEEAEAESGLNGAESEKPGSGEMGGEIIVIDEAAVGAC